jgi:hypothetical protein
LRLRNLVKRTSRLRELHKLDLAAQNEAGEHHPIFRIEMDDVLNIAEQISSSPRGYEALVRHLIFLKA